MKVKYFINMIGICFILLCNFCCALQLEKDLSFNTNGKLSKVQLFKSINSTIKTLNLSGQSEVDDEFIAELSNSKNSQSLMNIDLSGTRITNNSLNNILSGEFIGTRRDIPQISERFELPSTEILLDLEDTLAYRHIEYYINKPFRVKIKYTTPDLLTITSPESMGIRLLKFRKKKQWISS